MTIRRAQFVTFALAAVLAVPSGALANAHIVIVNGNAPGVGFNDTTAATPTGGNTGTTVGAQRLNAFQFAADRWGETIDSNVVINILATFEPLACTATSAVLGSAGASFFIRDFPANGLFPGALRAGTWYTSALADKLIGLDIGTLLTPPQPNDIRARFNSNLGQAGCLTGTGWYLGFDDNHGSNIDLVTVLEHEFAHGLGFIQTASITSGALLGGFPDAYNHLIVDNTTNKYWDQMTNAERAASAKNPRRVAFDGPTVNASVPSVLQPGTPLLRVTAPAGIAGAYSVGNASFGPALTATGVSGTVVAALDAANAAGPTTTDACTPLTNAGAVAGKIALVDRGTCGFIVKVKNAQNAGAVAVVVADNVAGGPPAGLGGVDPTITIPSVRITLADGAAIRAALGSGVSATLGLDLSTLAGADQLGRALLFTPDPVQAGSTISHWDTIATPNQLMEPAINPDLTHSVKPPQDLTLPLLRDVGWFADADVDGLADAVDACPTSDRRSTVFVGDENTGVANPMFTNGCTIGDLIANAAAGARNHGGFVSDVAHLLNALRDAEIITNEEKGIIQSAAGRSKLP